MSGPYESGFYASPSFKGAQSSPNLLRGVKLNVSGRSSPLSKPHISSSISDFSSSNNAASSSSPSSPSKRPFRGDRFIAARNSIDLPIAQFVLSNLEEPSTEQSIAAENYKRSLARNLFDSEAAAVLLVGAESDQSGTQLISKDSLIQTPDHISFQKNRNCTSSPQLASPRSPSRILNFGNNSPASSPSKHKVLFSHLSQSPNRKTMTRVIPTVPERVLDAPGIIDDYYLNLLDWSSSNIIAIALAQSVYLWNASNAETTKLMTFSDDNAYVSSLSFCKKGAYLAIGDNFGHVQLWDVERAKQVRNMQGHTSRVCSLSWNNEILSSGSRDTNIINHDVRLANHRVSTFEGHNHEVCGLKWSPDGTQLASGSNDNILNIWSLQQNRPTFSFNQHRAAVKAIDWCPWQRNLLASGGGTADKTIKFWNTSTGTCLHSVDSKSQVCSIKWSKQVKELVSSHGYSNNQLTVWKYPSMNKQAELTGHTSRVLHMSMSPDGTTVVTAAADETLRFWKVFDVESAIPRLPKSTSELNLKMRTIR